jgi:uncharacterized membrane protein
MPPDNPLNRQERTLIRLWIEQGALETSCNDSCSNYSFSENISHIIQSNCVACHSSPSPNAGVSLENYDQIKSIADEGRLVDVINGLNNLPFNASYRKLT